MAEQLRVLLVVTGDLEANGLPRALESLFDGVRFVSQKVHAFTGGGTLFVAKPSDEATKADALVHGLLGAALATAPGDAPFDYAIAIEDVELHNEPRVLDPKTLEPDAGILAIQSHLQQAIERVLRQLADVPAETEVLRKGSRKQHLRLDTDEKRRTFLRKRCSFHLLRPMVESLFFAEGPQAIGRAAGSRTEVRKPCLNPEQKDVEAFCVDDCDYAELPAVRFETAFASQRRAHHPKHYLDFLINPSGARKQRYREADGVRAVIDLDWQRVVATPSFARMARSLLFDLSLMLRDAKPWLTAAGCHPLTAPQLGAELPWLLRNLR